MVAISDCEKAYIYLPTYLSLLETKEAMEMISVAGKCHEKSGSILLREMRIEKVGTRMNRVHSGGGPVSVPTVRKIK